MLTEPPVRLCCGSRHWSAQCPDGKVMCCLCFDRFTVGELDVTDDGTPVDVCKPCAEHDREMVRRRDGHDSGGEWTPGGPSLIDIRDQGFRQMRDAARAALREGEDLVSVPAAQVVGLYATWEALNERERSTAAGAAIQDRPARRREDR